MIFIMPFVLLFFGFTLVFISIRIIPPRDGITFRRRRRILRAISFFFLVFLGFALAMFYFDVWEGPYGIGGNDFVWNGFLDLMGLYFVDTSTPTYLFWWKNLIAFGLIAVGLVFFWIGYGLGFVFGDFPKIDL